MKGMNAGITLRLGQNDDGRRLDKILRIALGELPLSAIHKAIRKGTIKVNGARQTPDYRCRAGDIIEYRHLKGLTSPQKRERESIEHSQRLNQPFDSSILLLETEDLLFINKPAGILVHDGADSLEAWVRGYLSGKLEESQAFSPGPLHRLDRNTSGMIVFSRSIFGARVFSEALRTGSVRKVYVALLKGEMRERLTWSDMMTRDAALHKSYISNPNAAQVDAKKALAVAQPILSNADLTLAAIKLETGRTHQIRAQASAHGYPLAGDLKYGGGAAPEPYYLHAWELSFASQLFPDVPLDLVAPLPLCFLEKVKSTFSIAESDVYSMLRQFRF